jgi:hypothetical protein
VGFFDPPPAEPPPPAAAPRYRPPEWSGPPENVIPGVAALELVLAHTGRTAVWISDADAYPNGAIIKVGLRGRGPARPDVESRARGWRFGLQFSDGRKLSAYGLGAFARLGGVRAWSSATATARNPREARPDAPLLVGRGGGGSLNSWRQEYWLWPLPPPGDLLVACEWPEIGLELSTATVNAAVFRDAARRAQELWPAEDLPEWPGTATDPNENPS